MKIGALFCTLSLTRERVRVRLPAPVLANRTH
jgi:hypothetical protein